MEEENMTASSGMGGSGRTPRDYTGRWEWHRTPRWMFWRPAWRKVKDEGSGWDNDSYTYQTQQQRAREVLAEKFNDDPSPMQAQERRPGTSWKVPR